MMLPTAAPRWPSAPRFVPFDSPRRPDAWAGRIRSVPTDQGDCGNTPYARRSDHRTKRNRRSHQGHQCRALTISCSKPIDFNELLARTRSLIKLKQYTDEMENAEAVLFSLALSIEARDPYTRGHCERLSAMSARLAERMSPPEEHIKALRRAGVGHDIGKVVVPDSILLKPAALSPEEMDVMRKHPVVGQRICAPLKILRLVLPIRMTKRSAAGGTASCSQSFAR
jgi:HD-GYP domain-containing protein (c-di-GMP phosphodiesterase class II)